MAKIMFVPFSIAAGYAAAFAGKKLFDVSWGLIDDQEPPQPEHREVDTAKMLAALALQGAVFYVTRGLAERGSRTSFYRLTGRWPGEEEPDEK